MVIIWSKLAVSQLAEVIDFITESGYLKYAYKLETEIFAKVERLSVSPSLYPIDKYKKDNDGSYRAFEIEFYRISYRVKNGQIRVIRIRHTSRKVSKY